jgi:predicted PurR-regulated permease PerM
VVLVALFIGGKLWGVLGAILLIPLVAILFEFLKDFLKEKKEELFSSPAIEETTEE